MAAGGPAAGWGRVGAQQWSSELENGDCRSNWLIGLLQQSCEVLERRDIASKEKREGKKAHGVRGRCLLLVFVECMALVHHRGGRHSACHETDVSHFDSVKATINCYAAIKGSQHVHTSA